MGRKHDWQTGVRSSRSALTLNKPLSDAIASDADFPLIQKCAPTDVVLAQQQSANSRMIAKRQDYPLSTRSDSTGRNPTDAGCTRLHESRMLTTACSLSSAGKFESARPA